MAILKRRPIEATLDGLGLKTGDVQAFLVGDPAAKGGEMDFAGFMNV
jgi:hypothetical protein